jgi:hypothetical protein
MDKINKILQAIERQKLTFALALQNYHLWVLSVLFRFQILTLLEDAIHWICEGTWKECGMNYRRSVLKYHKYELVSTFTLKFRKISTPTLYSS